MDVSEMFESVKSALSAAWERIAFFVRTYRGVTVAVFLLLGAGLIFWASTGFSLEFSRFFASEPAPLGVPITPCSPLKGNGKLLTNWRPDLIPNPLDPTSMLPPCVPLPSIDGGVFSLFSIRSYDPITEVWGIPPAMTSSPRDWARCLVVLDRRSESPFFSGLLRPSTILQQNKDAKAFYKALVINNCPWTVHLSVKADGGADTTEGIGFGSRRVTLSPGELLRAFRRDPRDLGDFPSCWNTSSGNRPFSCAKEITIEHPLATYTCGSAGLTLEWFHYTNNNTPGEYTPDDPALKRTVKTSIVHNGVCTGSSAERQPGLLGDIPFDPSGACEFRTDAFNDPDGADGPEGAWYCKDLKCALAGNPPFEPTEQRKPPSGPASRININVMGVNPQPVVPEYGPIFIRYVLDSTPKNGSTEGYPPKDPLWSCTRPDGKEVDLGRNGHDFYTCYNPIIRVYDYVPVTCCANTGLSGDCFTWQASPAGSISPSPGPGSSTSPGPSVSASPTSQVQCSPVQQTVETNQIARLQASGGTSYSWDIGGGSLVEDNGSSIGVKFGVSGTKTIRVTSNGQTASCTVTVETPEATDTPSTTPSPSESVPPSASTSVPPGYSTTPVPSGGYVTPVVSNGVTITPGPGTRDSDGDGMTDTTECPNASRCPDSDGDGIADWQDPDIRNRVGRVLSASEVATGPGEATILALIISALVSLLYVTYTHSPLALRREVEDISKERDPLDFRS